MGFYHAGARHFQDRFDTRRLADRLNERLVVSELDDEDRAVRLSDIRKRSS